MDTLLLLTLQNTAVAFVLALCVYALTRAWRNPPAAHVLWVLVLLKLLAPPVLRVDWPAFATTAARHASSEIAADTSPIADPDARVVDRVAGPLFSDATAAGGAEHRWSSQVSWAWNRSRIALLWIWLGGAAACAVTALARIVRFERRLRETLPASARLQRLASETAARLGVWRVPEVRCVEGVDVPMLWCAGRRPAIVFPLRMLAQLDEPQLALILAHELAHLRRRDHWVRGVELAVSVIHWWNPLAWIIRRRIHELEELCCDAWVRSTFPDCKRVYAEVLLATAESLGASPVGMRLLPASPFLRALSLKARIEMILESRFAPTVPRRSALAITVLALLVLPWFIEITKTKALAGAKDEAAASSQGKSEVPATLAFPHAVRFEQGATRFANGDKITIQEIRGTSEAFSPGNLYWIRGTYALASRDRASLAAYTTARDSENGRGISYKVQTGLIEKGEGTFTLILPMSCRGWPHVSFYPADGGEGFGGNYFGTGDSVLKRWWGEKE